MGDSLMSKEQAIKMADKKMSDVSKAISVYEYIRKHAGTSDILEVTLYALYDYQVKLEGELRALQTEVYKGD